MIPTTPPDFHGSHGEDRVFRALRTLPDSYVIIHSLRWLHPGNVGLLTRNIGAQGEGDFVLYEPSIGVMVVEVKGGEIWCELGEWRQKNRRTGHVDVIYPETQASNTMHRIRAEVLKKVPEAGGLLFCHAVWFPDGAVPRTNLPMNYHPDMTLDSEDITRPDAAITRAFHYWHSMFPHLRQSTKPPAKKILDALAPTLSIVRSVRQALDEREEQLVQLTREQARVVQFLDEQQHAAIIGAAGTGKTLLAVEKARRLASPSEPVLFLCFNAALREHLEAHHAQPNVRYLTFHGFARDLMGPQGSLEDAVQSLLVHLTDKGTIPYSHVVIDEGQDFERDWLEFLRYRFSDGSFYVFYDRHQAIQGEMDMRWLDEIPCRLVLTRNCRNTDPIAKLAYRARGIVPATTMGIDGPQPVLHNATDTADAVRIAAELVRAGCAQHQIPAHEIAVLTLETLNKQSPWQIDRIGDQRTADKPQPNHVTVATVRRFKGLEATLVIVVDVDFAHAVEDEWRRRLYVACSRARHAVHIITCTHESDLKEPLRAFAGTDKVRPSWRWLSRHLGIRLGGGNLDPFN